MMSKWRRKAGPEAQHVGAATAAAMPDEKILRDKVRAVVLSGKVPSRRPDRTWGGPGVGAPCAVCDLPVTGDQSGNPGLDKFHVHIRCFAAWEFERGKKP